ncbi:MAG: hypothetical protein IH851_07570 [Armatimonadetes bacterium]|nr:hypothetical protein [Armatimonadota bacterium]
MRTIWSAGCVLLLGTAMPAAGWGFKVEIVVEGGSGAIYPIRWGQSDSNDLVNPYPRWESPFCVKKDSKIGVRIVWEFAEIKDDWAVVWAVLESKVVPLQYWNDNTCIDRHGYHPHDGVHWFVDDARQWPDWADHNIPDFIEWAFLSGDLVLLNPPEGAGGSAAYESDVFVVLDQPKAPMDPAWVSVLQVSCTWGRTTDVPLAATGALALEFLKQGEYEPFGDPVTGKPWYTLTASDTQETFYLKAFLDRTKTGKAGPLTGMCNDFADFLVCAVTSVGAYDMKAQRPYSLTLAFRHKLQNQDPPWWDFLTNFLIKAPYTPTGPQVQLTFTYHQFGIVGSLVWDPTAYYTTPAPDGFAFGMEFDQYDWRLVEYFRRYEISDGLLTQTQVGVDDPGNPWVGSPPGGFLPILTTADPPP